MNGVHFTVISKLILRHLDYCVLFCHIRSYLLGLSAFGKFSNLIQVIPI